MTAKVLTLQKGWHRTEREPLSVSTRLALVNPNALSELEGCPNIMNVKKAAEILDFSAYSVAEWCREEIIKAKKIRGEWRISKRALAEFLILEDMKAK